MFSRSISSLPRPPILVLGAVELLILCTSIYVADLVTQSGLAGRVGSADSLEARMSVFAGTMFACLISMGLYHFHQRATFREVFVRVCVGLLLGFLVLAAIYFALPSLALGRRVSGVAAIYAVALIVPIRLLFMSRVDENIFKRRTLIFGGGKRSRALQDLRRKADRRGFTIVSWVAAPGDDNDSDCTDIRSSSKPIDVLANELDVDEVVVAMDDRRGNLPIRELLDLKLRGVNVIDLVEFLERETGKIRVDLVNPGSLVFSSGFRTHMLRRYEKRAVDLLFSCVIAIATAPVMLLVAACIKLESGLRAPVLYRQQRVGHRGEVFHVLKFRSMIEDAEANGEPVWAVKNDDRVTRVGTVLRKFRLDELPQILNVLQGDMSLVGPRPERPAFVAELTEKIPYYAERHSVKPGVTGWAQLRYSYGGTTEDAMEKLQYDLYYVKNHNLLLDILILMQTVEVVLWGKGAR